MMTTTKKYCFSYPLNVHRLSRMKKLSIIIVSAITVLPLVSCSNENAEPEVTIDPKTGVEVIHEPVEIKLGTPAVNITRAALEDNATSIKIGVFCLAREKQNINKTEQEISWWDSNVYPAYSSTFCLLKNVKSTKTGDNVTWDDNQRRYYPFTQFYAYDFYAYYPYVPFGLNLDGNSIDTTHVGKVYVKYKNLDGKTDILWGRATSSDAYAYSAKYFRQPGNQSKKPMTQLDHMLTRLKFQVIPGADGNGDYTEAAKLKVASLKVCNVKRNYTLLLADYDLDSVNKKGSDYKPDATDEPNRLYPTDDEVQTLSLCDFDGNPFESVSVPANPANPVQLGESFLLYPQSEYNLEITLTDNSGTIIYQQDHPLELRHPDSGAGGVFEAGRQYTITLEVHGPQEVSIKAQLTPWQDSDLTESDQKVEL